MHSMAAAAVTVSTIMLVVALQHRRWVLFPRAKGNFEVRADMMAVSHMEFSKPSVKLIGSLLDARSPVWIWPSKT